MDAAPHDTEYRVNDTRYAMHNTAERQNGEGPLSVAKVAPFSLHSESRKGPLQASAGCRGSMTPCRSRWRHRESPFEPSQKPKAGPRAQSILGQVGRYCTTDRPSYHGKGWPLADCIKNITATATAQQSTANYLFTFDHESELQISTCLSLIRLIDSIVVG